MRKQYPPLTCLATCVHDHLLFRGKVDAVQQRCPSNGCQVGHEPCSHLNGLPRCDRAIRVALEAVERTLAADASVWTEFLVLHGLVRHRQSVQRQIGARCAQYWTAARCRPARVSMAELAEAGTAAIGGRRALLLGRSTAKHSTDLSRSVPPWCCNNPAHPRKTGHLLAGAQSWAARVSQQTVKPPP